jgi:hypothetical protein
MSKQIQRGSTANHSSWCIVLAGQPAAKYYEPASGHGTSIKSNLICAYYLFFKK